MPFAYTMESIEENIRNMTDSFIIMDDVISAIPKLEFSLTYYSRVDSDQMELFWPKTILQENFCILLQTFPKNKGLSLKTNFLSKKVFTYYARPL